MTEIKQKNSSNNSLEKHLEFLTEELSCLKTEVKELSARLSTLENGSQAIPRSEETSFAASSADPESVIETEVDVDTFWSWISTSSLLPRVATICFILVIALILRTLTDTGIIAMHTGSYVGMGYAATLIAGGWWMLARRNNLGPVFPVFGALLMYIILLETHSRFEAVPSIAAYIILFCTLLALTNIGVRYDRPFLSSLGIFCTSFFAVSIDFPTPYFPNLIFLLLVANFVAYLICLRQPECQWTRWFLFIITVLTWFVWASKLRIPLEQEEVLTKSIAYPWFLPSLVIFAASYMLMTVRRALQDKKLGALDAILPTANVLWAFSATWIVISIRPGASFGLGIFGLAIAVLHFCFAFLIFKKGMNAAPGGICAFTFAGCSLVLLSVPLATDSILISLPIWAGVALGLSRMYSVCEIGGIRLSSYMLQVLACGGGVMLWSSSANKPESLLASLVVATILMIMSGFHYRWSRDYPPVCSAGFFGKIDINDRSAIVLLFAALVNGFFMLTICAADIITKFTGNIDNILTGVQSIFINSGAIGLMYLGLSKKNNELLGTAVAVAILGALKVFAFDFFETHGIPLVLSVLSFGAVAAFGSMVLRRWQRNNAS